MNLMDNSYYNSNVYHSKGKEVGYLNLLKDLSEITSINTTTIEEPKEVTTLKNFIDKYKYPKENVKSYLLDRETLLKMKPTLDTILLNIQDNLYFVENILDDLVEITMLIYLKEELNYHHSYIYQNMIIEYTSKTIFSKAKEIAEQSLLMIVDKSLLDSQDSLNKVIQDRNYEDNYFKSNINIADIDLSFLDIVLNDTYTEDLITDSMLSLSNGYFILNHLISSSISSKQNNNASMLRDRVIDYLSNEANLSSLQRDYLYLLQSSKNQSSSKYFLADIVLYFRVIREMTSRMYYLHQIVYMKSERPMLVSIEDRKDILISTYSTQKAIANLNMSIKYQDISEDDINYIKEYTLEFDELYLQKETVNIANDTIRAETNKGLLNVYIAKNYIYEDKINSFNYRYEDYHPNIWSELVKFDKLEFYDYTLEFIYSDYIEKIKSDLVTFSANLQNNYDNQINIENLKNDYLFDWDENNKSNYCNSVYLEDNILKLNQVIEFVDSVFSIFNLYEAPFQTDINNKITDLTNALNDLPSKVLESAIQDITNQLTEKLNSLINIPDIQAVLGDDILVDKYINSLKQTLNDLLSSIPNLDSILDDMKASCNSAGLSSNVGTSIDQIVDNILKDVLLDNEGLSNDIFINGIIDENGKIVNINNSIDIQLGGGLELC